MSESVTFTISPVTRAESVPISDRQTIGTYYVYSA